MREKAEKPAKRKLTRNQRKQIEAVIRQAKGDGKNHTVQDSIPFQNMFPDGLCRLEGGTFSKTISPALRLGWVCGPKAVIEKLVSADVLTDPVRFNEAIVELGSQFTVDDTFTNQEMIDLGLSMRITGGSDVVSLQAPTAGFGTSSDGQSYVAVDTDGLADLAEALRNDTMDALAGSE